MNIIILSNIPMKLCGWELLYWWQATELVRGDSWAQKVLYMRGNLTCAIFCADITELEMEIRRSPHLPPLVPHLLVPLSHVHTVLREGFSAGIKEGAWRRAKNEVFLHPFCVGRAKAEHEY